MVASTRLRLIWRHFTHNRMGDMSSKTQLPTPETALPGRSESLKVSAKHHVSANRTVPPFPEGTQMVMFGKTGLSLTTSLSLSLSPFFSGSPPSFPLVVQDSDRLSLSFPLPPPIMVQVLTEGGFGSITTEISEAQEFYYAEDNHQQYLSKNPHGYCGLGGTGLSCPIGVKS
ncbi:mitochondrial peptide methionine sulfoxide reductase [Osmerus eperlanus]|uniref:mitochondrial peptide methionine sulfoxide reductase n=1 Tax=Osmerus eperlanus TaxID=29151 RepID=UPI002E118C03